MNSMKSVCTSIDVYIYIYTFRYVTGKQRGEKLFISTIDNLIILESLSNELYTNNGNIIYKIDT